MKKNLFPLLALILVACASPQVTVTSQVTVTLPPTFTAPPTLHPTFTPTPTAPDSGVDTITLPINPDQPVAVGEGVLGSQEGMTVYGTELKYSSPESVAAARRAGLIYIWAATQAGHLTKGLSEAGITDDFVSFDEWVAQAEKDNWLVDGIYLANAHPNPQEAKQGVAEVEPVSGKVDLSQIEFVFHEPGDTRHTPAFSDAEAFGGFWIKSRMGENGKVVIDLGMGLDSDQFGVFYANAERTPEENAEAYSQMLNIVAIDMEGLAELSTAKQMHGGVILDGVVEKGDPREIFLRATALLASSIADIRPTLPIWLEVK